MRDYLTEGQEWMESPLSIRQMLAKDYNLILAAIGSRLKFENTYTRKYAAYSLGQIGDDRALEYLQAAHDSETMEGVRLAMAAALAAIKKMPATSGATEEQRCQYMQHIYEASLPDHIRQKMLSARGKTKS